jgi:hypothetical protein
MKKVFIPRNSNYFPWYLSVNDATIDGIRDILMISLSGVLTATQSIGRTKEQKNVVENDKIQRLSWHLQKMW